MSDLERLVIVCPDRPDEGPSAWMEDDRHLEAVEPRYRKDVESAIRSLGWDSVWLESPQDLLSFAPAAKVGDFVLQLGWAPGGRNRKTLVPALCEILGLPFWGADAHAHSLAKEKAISKLIAEQAGFMVPRGGVVFAPDDPFSGEALRFPVIVKPAYEGGSIGISDASICHDPESMQAAASRVIRRYEEPAIIEEFISGKEVTIVVVGDERILRLGVVETCFADGSSFGTRAMTQEVKKGGAAGGFKPVLLPLESFPDLPNHVRRLSRVLGPCDVFRIDARLTENGELYFLEVNPDIHLGMEGSVFDLYSLQGIPYPEFFLEIMEVGAEKWGIRI